MDWPQITMIVIITLNLGVVMAKDGQPSGKHSFIRSGVGAAVTLWLLIAGGFFQ